MLSANTFTSAKIEMSSSLVTELKCYMLKYVTVRIKMLSANSFTAARIKMLVTNNFTGAIIKILSAKKNYLCQNWKKIPVISLVPEYRC